MFNNLIGKNKELGRFLFCERYTLPPVKNAMYIAEGQELKRGAVVDVNGVLVGTNSLMPYAVLEFDCDTRDGGKEASVFIKGEFNFDKLTFADGLGKSDLDNIVYNGSGLGIVIKPYEYAEGFSQSSNIAPNYTKKTYEANSYVMQDGILYTNPNAIETAEDWNPAHWTQTTVAEAVDAAKEEMQGEINEVTLDPSAVALGNVHLLDEVTSFAADAKILVDSETNGPGAMTKDNLLAVTAQNALAGNVAPAFDENKTYVQADIVVKDGVLLQAKENITAGTFDASKWEALPVSEFGKNLDLGVNLSFIGKGQTAVVRYISVSENVSSIAIKATPNPWPISEITGTKPSILYMTALSLDGTSLLTLCNYDNTDTIPASIEKALPSGTAFIRIFARANVGEKVTLSFINNYIKETDEKIEKYNSLGSGVSKSVSLTGKNLTFAEHIFVVEEGVKKVSVEISPAPWPINSISGSNPGILYLYPVFSDGTEGGTLIYASATNPGTYPYYECALPDGTKKLHLKIRANNGSNVNITLKPLPTGYNFSEQDFIFGMQNAVRRNVRIPLAIVVGDPHASKNAFVSATEAARGINTADFIICMGDMCSDHPTEQSAYSDYYLLFNTADAVPVLPVIGNHDTGSTNYIGNYVPVSKCVENVMKPAIDKGFIPSNSGGYYYKDFSSRKLRVIVLNQYELGGVYGGEGKWDQVAYDSNAPEIQLDTAYAQGDKVNIPGWTDYSYQANTAVTTPATVPSTWSADIPCWKTRRPDRACFGQTQAQWLADTLLSTPANYGVVIATHTYFSYRMTPQVDKKFCMNGVASLSTTTETDFLANVVTAFQNGDNYSETVSYATVEPYVVSCNFAAKHSGVKFLGFLSGHLHYDAIFKHNTNPSLLAIHVCAAMNSALSDIRYFTLNETFHSNFTLIGFDVANKALNLVKIGNKLTDDGYIRDCERIEIE